MPSKPPTIGTPKAHRKAVDRARGTRQQRGYDRAWERCRDAYTASKPLCEQCLREGRTEPATLVDHIIRIRKGGARLDPANLQSLCGWCHGCKTRWEQKPMKRVVVTGPPGSGKTTWVRQQAQPGDIVWDLDTMAETLTGGPISKGKMPTHLLKLTLTLRASMVEYVRSMAPDANVYIIATSATEAHAIADQIGGTVQVMGSR